MEVGTKSTNLKSEPVIKQYGNRNQRVPSSKGQRIAITAISYVLIAVAAGAYDNAAMTLLDNGGGFKHKR